MKKTYETPLLLSVCYITENVLATSFLVDGNDTIVDYDNLGGNLF